jgi:hypothetical protein
MLKTWLQIKMTSHSEAECAQNPNLSIVPLFITDAIIEKTSMKFAKRVLRISPPVPRRMGHKEAGDDSSIFHLKFKSDSDRDEVKEILGIMVQCWSIQHAYYIAPPPCKVMLSKMTSLSHVIRHNFGLACSLKAMYTQMHADH